MKKQFILLTALVLLQVCLLTLKTNIANACDRKCNAASFKTKKITPKEINLGEESNTDSRIHPFPFGVI
jgi:hypothetical protein